MTYTAASPILGVGKSTAAQIDRFFEIRGRSYAGDKYRPAPAGIGQIIRDAARRWQQSINHDLLAAQIVHETGAWQSEFARERNNPSGLGAVNDAPGNAIRFETPQEGIRSTVAHLLTYISGPGPWTEYDPRASVTPAENQGAVKLLRDLEQKWAFTRWDKYNATPEDQRYGAKIAQIANALLLVKADDVPATTTYPKPQMIWYPSPNKDRYDASDGMTTPRTIEAVCLHVGTSTKASNLGWLTNPASQASCNAYVDKQGQIYEMVPMASAAWTAGRVNKPDLSNPLIKRWVDNGWNPNTRLYNIETEGNPSDDLTEPQLQSITEIIAWVSDANQFPVSRVHVIGHYQIDSVDRSHCPSFTDTEWTRIVAGARNLRDTFDPDTPDTPSVPTLPPTVPEPNRDNNPWNQQRWIPEPFMENIDEYPWWVTGWAVSEAFLEDGKLVQYFERARLELQPDGTVTRGLVGWESMISKHPERAA